MLTNSPGESSPRTEALRQALLHVQDEAVVADLAVQDPSAFKSIFDRAAEALQKKHAA